MRKGIRFEALLRGGASLAVLAAAVSASAAYAQDAQPPAAQPAPVNATAAAPQTAPDTAQAAGDTGSDIVITGFRGSLAKALDQKKNETAAIDSILAEDIGKFPDLNLSESIQRIPGVAITRDGGEGRNISVRGLGPQFTRVRIDGMEAIATAGGADTSGGTNRGRGFDFNVFASDLFNGITVRKTQQASVEEGSLGATVDLRTARPFDYSGFKIAASAQGSYNDQSKAAEPRLSFMISDHFFNDTIGVLFSAAYQKRDTIEEGYSTVRWAPNTVADDAQYSPHTLNFSPGWQSVLGTTCPAADPKTLLTGVAICDEANRAFHPRFPRYDWYEDKESRLGFTGSIQWKPSENTLVSLDGLYADFKATRQERYLEANGLSVAGACTAASKPTNCGIADMDITKMNIVNGIMQSATFNDADIRVENRFDELDTKFKQATLDLYQKLGNVTLTGLFGYSKSDHENPIQNTITFDQYNVQGFSYDYSNKNVPVFNWGNANLSGPQGWVLSQIRLRAATAVNTYKTAQGNFDWAVNDEFHLLGGVDYKEYQFSTTYLQRSIGTTAAQDTNVGCCTLPGDTLDKFGHLVTIEGQQFFDSDYFAANKYFDLTSPTARGGAFKLGPEPGLANNNSVGEKDTAAYFQVNFNHSFGGITLRGDAGFRYVHTQQDAQGFGLLGGTLVPITTSRHYDDYLPAMNLVLELTPKFQLRASAAKVMARPDLGSLAPGVAVAVSGANRTVTAGNPNLDPYRATTIDLSAEWYFQPGALLSVAFFQKRINSFVQTLTSTGAFSTNQFGLPDSAAIAACGNQYPSTCNPAFPNWSFSVPTNTPGGTLNGIEINYQQPLKFLPGFLRNTGVLLNYTYISSSIKYENGSGIVVAEDDLTGLSRHSANATFYYEDKVFSGRVSAAYRNNYLTRVPGQQGTDLEGTAGTLNIDVSAQLSLTKQVKLTFEGINLTNEATNQYVDSRELSSVYHTTGREFIAGVRFNY
jgi:TonB-dependent receptor